MRKRKKNKNTEPTMLLPIEKTIAELSSPEQRLLNARLAELSNLSSAELTCLKHSWATIELKRRRQIISRLVELAEDDLTLNFNCLFKHCLQDPDDEVRRQAIEGLWESEEASLINPLVNLLKQDSSEPVQAAAATALGKFALLAEHQKLRSHHMLSLQEALLSVLSDQTQPLEVRRRALEAAAPLSLPQVKTAIMAAYDNPDARLKASAIYAMGKNCDPRWLAILLRELASTDTEIRYEAAGACGELEEETAVPYLIELVNDPDVDVRMAAIQALGKIGSAEAKKCLESCLDDASEAIRQAAEQALLTLETPTDSLSFPPETPGN